MKKPLPIPEGITQEEMEAIPITAASNWRKSDDFVHRKCGNNALLHPYTNKIWGCERCNFFTYSPSLFFNPINKKLIKKLCVVGT